MLWTHDVLRKVVAALLAAELKLAVLGIFELVKVVLLVEDHAHGDLIVAELAHIMLLLEGLLVLDAAAREQPEDEPALVDRRLEQLQADAHDEDNDELETGNCDQKHDRVHDGVSGDERIVLASLVE